MLKGKLGILLAFILLAGSAVSRADTSPEAAPALSTLPASALEAFDKGDYDKAITDYEKLVASGYINGHLFYNLGTSYYRGGHRGAAMAAFLAARRYLPRSSDAKANIQYLLADNTDKLSADIKTPISWVRVMTPREWAILTGFFWALWGVTTTTLTLVQRFGGYKNTAVSLIALPLLLSFILGLALKEDSPWGAVAASSAKIYSGPDPGKTLLFELHEGAPFEIEDKHEAGFYKIQLSDGKKGWIAAQDSKIVGPDT